MGYNQINDKDFIRGKVPMTKGEIRSLSILKMKIKDKDVVWDVGAGTGSISIEIAKNYPDTEIFAIEKNPEGISIIKENLEKFEVLHITIVNGTAPEVFSDLKMPNRVIIGGSGGNLEEILELLWSYPSIENIVVNAITINTAYKAIEFFSKKNTDFEAFQIGISNIEMIKDYQMLKGQNPIFIISADKQEEK